LKGVWSPIRPRDIVDQVIPAKWWK
jgi:hypothetical protein